MARKLTVEIVGDASSLHRAFGQAADSGSRFGSTLKTVGKTAAFAAGGAALGGVALTLRAGISEFNESSRVAAQTAAALKSTGGAANVTAKDIDNLATRIMNYSGMDDEAIKSGENLLLTFTKIRNETGKGNDIFTQATKTITDMSVALGQDMKSSAIQVGKALNDPIKGVTALQRVGVAFDASQRQMIKDLVEGRKAADNFAQTFTGKLSPAQTEQIAKLSKLGVSWRDIADQLGIKVPAAQAKLMDYWEAGGHQLEAQKKILGELNREFGGSAKAAGDTLPGQLNKLKETFNNVAGEIVAKAVPALNNFVEFINRNMPTIQKIMEDTATVIGVAFKASFDVLKVMVDVIKTAIDIWTRFRAVLEPVAAALGVITTAIIVYVGVTRTITAVTEAWAAAQLLLNAAMAANPFVLIAVALVALGAALVVAYKRSETFRDIVNSAFKITKEVISTAVSAITRVLDALRPAFETVANVARQMAASVKGIVEGIVQVIRGFVNIVAGIFTGDWSRAWNGLKSVAQGAWRVFESWLGGLSAIVAGLALRIGKAIVTGIVNGLASLVSEVGAKLASIRSALSAAASAAAGLAYHIGLQIVQGVISGMGGLFGAIKSKAESAIHSALSTLNPFSTVAEGAAQYIGKPIIDGSVKGIDANKAKLNSKAAEAVRDAVQKAQQAVADAKGGFQSAFSDLASAALAAFDKVTQDWVPPSQRILDKLNLKEQLRQLRQDFQDAQQEVISAQAGLATAQASGDPAAIEQANEQLKAALQARSDAVLAIQKYSLEQQAAQEQAAYDAKREAERVRMTNDLIALQNHIQNMLATHQGGQTQILKMLKGFEDNYHIRGLALGAQLAEGLRDAKGWVIDAANELAEAVARALNVATTAGNLSAKQISERLTGRASGGPVKAGTPYIVGEAGPELFVPNQSGRIVANTVSGGTPVGGNTFVFQFPNYVGNRNELIEEVRRGLYEVARRNPGALPGVA